MYRANDKTAFHVDLIRQQALCEVNYTRLLALLPELHEQPCYRISITHNDHQQHYSGSLGIDILHRAPYTTLISLRIEANWGSWVFPPKLEIRLYHDVQMAEVVMAENIRQFPLVTEYPNKKMSTPNEKLQINQFLAELLDYCMTGGHISEQVF